LDSLAIGIDRASPSLSAYEEVPLRWTAAASAAQVVPFYRLKDKAVKKIIEDTGRHTRLDTVANVKAELRELTAPQLLS